MPERSPPSLSNADIQARHDRVLRIAEQLGFVGRVEYRHEYSRSGGAQYGQARTAENDRLIVYAEAFDRDADPDDFSLDAILAHERGHQILIRHPRIAKSVALQCSSISEEILASVVGSIIGLSDADRELLFDLAVVGLEKRDNEPSWPTELLLRIRSVMEQML